MKILIGPSSFAEIDNTPLVLLQQAGYEIIGNPYGRKLTKLELLNLLKHDVGGIIAGLEPLDRDVLKNSSLKVISRCGSGLSNIDLAVAKELSIKICSTPDAPVQAVAELTLGTMLSLIRMIPQMNSDLHQSNWNKQIGTQLDGKIIVIIGFGRIGKRLAELLKPFNTKIIAVDPYVTEFANEISIMLLEQALPLADIITIHSSGSTCILGARELALVKTGSFLLNAARGDLVDEIALVKAIEDGRIKGAWMDTFRQEPYSGPLIKYSQVILTPHVGSYTAECRKRMELEAANNLVSELKGVL